MLLHSLEAEMYLPGAIGPALEEDVPAIMDLLQRRIDWMDEKGLYQWNKTGYLTCYPPEHFRRLIREEVLLAARETDRLTGIMALLSRDPRWPNGDDGKAFYVHHLATDPACPGLGKEMLSYAESYARQHGKPFSAAGLPEGKRRSQPLLRSSGLFPRRGVCGRSLCRHPPGKKRSSFRLIHLTMLQPNTGISTEPI